MYQIQDYEFFQYETAEFRLKRMREQSIAQLNQAYRDIHPTRSCFNYDTGKIYSESIDPADYAVYLADLQAEHKKAEEWWRLRAELYREGTKRLSAEERAVLEADNDFLQVMLVKNKLRSILSEMIAERPDLQRVSSFTEDELESMDEADEEIDKMSMKEVMKDYVDLIDKKAKPEPKIRLIIPLEQKKKMNISPVKEWTMSESERVEYVAKHPIIKRSRKYYETRWLG